MLICHLISLFHILHFLNLDDYIFTSLTDDEFLEDKELLFACLTHTWAILFINECINESPRKPFHRLLSESWWQEDMVYK